MESMILETGKKKVSYKEVRLIQEIIGGLDDARAYMEGVYKAITGLNPPERVHKPVVKEICAGLKYAILEQSIIAEKIVRLKPAFGQNEM